MSVVAADLVAHLAASMPNDDASTSGGAIDTTATAALAHFSGNAKAALISDGADTRDATIIFRMPSGVLLSEVVTLTGAVEVLSVATGATIVMITLSAGSGSRTVLVKQGTGGTTRATLGPNIIKARCFFRNSVSAGSQVDRYEKLFWINNNGTNALLTALITLTSDPAAKITIGVESAVNDTVSVATRLTVPSNPTFVDDNVAVNVPGTDLAPGDKIGVWIRQRLATNNAALRDAFTTQASGSTT